VASTNIASYQCPQFTEEHLTQWLRIEWEKDPEEWMREAAIAFHSALHYCQRPDDKDVHDRTVIHVRVFKESERPQNCNGTSLSPPEEGQHEIIASQMVRRVTTYPVLWTWMGERLDSCRMLKVALATSVLGLVALHMMEPGATKVKVHDTVDPVILYNQTAVVVSKSSTSALLFHLVFYAFALYFVFHQISKDMLRLVTGFDSAVIVFSSAMCEITVFHELIYHYNVANKVFPAIDMILYVTRSLMRVTSHYTISVMDAWTFTTCGKMGVLIPFIISLSFAYFSQHLLGQWSRRETCAFGECNTWKGVYLTFLKNEIVFAIKLLIPYLRGRSYAVLNFHAVDPEKELHKRHKSVRQSHAISKSSQNSCSACRLEGVASVCIGKAMEDIIAEKERDLLEMNEIGQDDQCLHQIPNPGKSSHDGFGEMYFSRANLQVVAVTR